MPKLMTKLAALKNKLTTYIPNRKQRAEMWHFSRRYPSHPEDLDSFIASVMARTGASESDLSVVRAALLGWREAAHDTAAMYPVDRYLAAGMAAVDLVLFAIIVPLGVRDSPLFVALLTLAISLVLTATGLVVGHIKRNLGITGYGKIHGNVIFCSLAFGVAAFTATLWHESSFIALVFLGLTILAYVGCVFYIALAKVALETQRQLQAAPSAPNNSSNKANGGGDTTEPRDARQYDAVDHRPT